jgi:hypothetical protein
MLARCVKRSSLGDDSNDHRRFRPVARGRELEFTDDDEGR